MRHITDLLTPPSFWMPEHFVESAWLEHAPFAFWVVDAHRPRVLVELGTHHGFSYLAFCQAVERLEVGTRCYAVDTWKGDEHAGFYGEDVYTQLRAYHDVRYRRFSELLRTTFAEAARHFEDGSIDLVHIDGAHRIENVTEDFETWLPKMSARGVILFHDINVHRDEFGVYALWERIKGDYPHFSFDHGHGLGVLGVGTDAASSSLAELFTAESTPRGNEIRRAFARLGAGISDHAALLATRVEVSQRSLEAATLAIAENEARARHLAALAENEFLSRQLTGVRASVDGLNKRLAAQEASSREQARALEVAQSEVANLRGSTSWRVTAPLRAVSRGIAPVTRFIRRGTKVLWWTITLQLPRRLRAYRAYRSTPRRSPTAATIASERQRFSVPGPWFEELRPMAPRGTPLAKLLAMYLPQFHAIPENDEWWGTGFTEWTNLGKGSPRFVDHYQPRTPRDLGFYDLSDPQVMRRQIAMAQAAGIHGFCFYYYRFPEGRLLEKPLEAFLKDESLAMPFCLMWANENWTRTWDGHDTAVLRRQEYSAALEDELIADMVRHFADARYVRIDGRPLFLIYRPNLVPDPAQTFARWRSRIVEATGDALVILMAQSFNDFDPTLYGLDGAIEFPPHKYGSFLEEVQGDLEMLDPDFTGSVRSYADLVVAARDQPQPAYPLVRTVVPSWDNDARRPGRGLTLAGSTPALYQQWLDDSIEYAVAHPIGSQPLVFINAWNEWTEGAYLEPDTYYGAAYLNATSRALHGWRSQRQRRRLLLVGHDALPRGAQRTLLHLGRTLSQRFGLEVEFLLLEGGDLLDDYRAIGPVRVLPTRDPRLPAHLAVLAAHGYRHAITNTVVTGQVVPQLRDAGFTVVSLIHEMESFIQDRGWFDAARSAAQHANRLVFPAQFVADRFAPVASVNPQNVVVTPQGLYRELETPELDASGRTAVRRELGVPDDARIVLGVGYADLRKGFDLFAQAASTAATTAPDLVFVWVGGGERQLLHWVIDSQPKGGRTNLIVVGHTEEVGRYYAAADALFVSSREDAYPSTVLEALSYGLPVVAFDGCTGTGDLISRTGQLVPPFDLEAATNALATLVREQTAALAEARRQVIADDYRFDDYAFRLVQQALPNVPRVSAMVLTYNYGRYLEQRLTSVFEQTHPIFETVVLDDGSTDDTPKVLDRIRRSSEREFTVVRRETNSGSVWRQWRAAAAMARSEYLWIAEADDAARPGLLERLVEAMSGEGEPPVFAYCDSAQIDAEGKQIGTSYRSYLDMHAEGRFSADFRMAGPEFRKRHLLVRNLILNTSAIVFHRERLLEVLDRNLDDLIKLRFAGDWITYAELCSFGDVAFVAEPLNVHRRHIGLTFGSTPEQHVRDIANVHTMLNERFGVTDEIRAEQQRYRESVARQLTQPS